MRSRARPLLWIGVAGLALVGAVVAVFGALMSRADVRLLAVSWPLGLVFVLVVTVLSFRSARLALGRAGAIASAVGWVAGVALLLWPRRGGDVVLANDWLGLLFLLGGVVAATWNIGRSLSPSQPSATKPGAAEPGADQPAG